MYIQNIGNLNSQGWDRATQGQDTATQGQDTAEISDFRKRQSNASKKGKSNKGSASPQLSCQLSNDTN